MFVVADGDEVLVDINDSKIRGRALEQLRAEFGTPTFVFKSYSFAQAYPACYTADDPADLELITRDSYLDDWISVVTAARSDIRRAVRQHGRVPPPGEPPGEPLSRPAGRRGRGVRGSARPRRGTEAVQMDPGDRWSAESGFERGCVDWYSDREQRLDELARRVQPRIDAQTAAEEGKTLDYATFAEYFDGFLHAFPPGILGRFALRRPWCSRCRSSPLPYWVIDFRRRAVYRLSQPPPDTASIVRVNEAMLADAIDKRLVHVAHGSMRIAIHLRPGGAGDDITFWALLVPWELGYVPLQRSVEPAARRGGVATTPRVARLDRRPARRLRRNALRAPVRPLHDVGKSPSDSLPCTCAERSHGHEIVTSLRFVGATPSRRGPGWWVRSGS